ncbi:MAG: putative sensor protein [Pedosphaera sp.]|nr:putative sensor protein [Pedosphaera sp.]
MNQALRVLVIEDSENDAELMLRELRRGGYETRSQRVDSADAMCAALAEHEWDLIISDYVMPGFSGLEALALFKQGNLDVPFIVVSGHIGEDLAVETMKAGAHDYVMKDKMARLVPAVTRELRESAVRLARKKSDQALRESEERFRQLTENIGVVFFMFDRSNGGGPNRLLYVSPAYESIWGRSLASLYQDAQCWLKAVHPEDRENVLLQLPNLNLGEFNHEFRIVGLDGRVRWIHYRAFPVFNEQGGVYRIAATAEDITGRKLADQQLAENSRQLEGMVEELKAIDEQLRLSNREISESRAELEKRVRQRTADLTVANTELQCQINERLRLERELLEIAEKERRRIGFDLHDDLGQKLTGVAFMIKALERKVLKKHLPQVAETRRIHALINQIINHTHDLAQAFSSLDLEGDDLALELKELAAKVKKMFQVSCQFIVKGAVPSLPQNVTAQFYKIAQEAASNAVKHGKAKLLFISLTRHPDKLILMIKNNGFPFPEARKVQEGMGLRIMNSRASMIGAVLEIRPNGGDGTLVTCTLPLVPATKPAALELLPPSQPASLANGHAVAMACNGGGPWRD